MSTDLTVGLRRKAEAKRNGDVTIASIWSVLYLLMVVGAAAGVSILSSAPARAVWTEQLAIHHPISLEQYRTGKILPWNCKRTARNYAGCGPHHD